MEDETELLQTIRRKEAELAKTITAGRETAAAHVAAAEAEATRIRETAERESVVEAGVLKDEGITALKREAEKIVQEGEAERARILAGAESKIPAAADRIYHAVTLR